MNQQFKTPIPYGPDGCQVHIGNQICRETQTLEIIKEFNRIYESKLNELGSIGGGDNLSAKVHLQQDWIRDLTLQNEMLARTVEELEKEASERVTMLESQLHCGGQVMQRYKDKFSVYLNETFQNLDYLQNDVSSLIEFVRRVRDNNEWSIEGLNFYTIKPSCLLKTCSVCDCPGPYAQNLLPGPDANKLELQKQETVPGGPKGADLEEMNLKLRLKEEELNSMKRRSADVETDCSELRKRFKELEDENNQLKDTIFQANRELEKFYEQANDYLKERDEYKRLYNESVDALTLAERKSMMHEEALSKMNQEHVKIKEEITTCRRQSESLSQAQNETIQALQEAIREKEKASDLVPLTSDESWTSTTVSTATKGPICSCSSIGPPVDDGTPKDPSRTKKDGVSVKEIECPNPYPCAGEKLQQDLDAEREIHKKEVDNLKKTITELEKGGLDSIKSLEDAYEQSKLEISHQRITISNLQGALKICKDQLDELEKKSSSDVSWAVKWFGLSSSVSKTPANNNQSVHDV